MTSRGRQATGWFFWGSLAFLSAGVGGWGYVNVPWTCKDGWMLYNRCWRNINMYNCMLPYQVYVGPLNSEAGQTDGMGAVKLGAFYRTLVLIKTKRNWDILRSAINKLPARPYVKIFQVGQWFFPLLIIYSVFPRKCSMRFHAAKDMDDALSIGRFVEILLLDKK